MLVARCRSRGGPSLPSRTMHRHGRLQRREFYRSRPSSTLTSARIGAPVAPAGHPAHESLM